MGISGKSYGKRVKIEFVDHDGTVKQVKIPRSEIERWERQRQTRRLPKIQANISGVQGQRIEEWRIGKDISMEDAEKWRDPGTGELYVEERFEDGDLRQRLVKKGDA